MFRFKRNLATVVSVVLIIGALPFALGATNPKYNKNAGFSYLAPEQSQTIFTTRSVELNNANLAKESANGFVFSADISGWDKKATDTTTIGGALNLRQFSRFKSDYIKRDLSYLKTPPMNIGNDTVFFISNNLHEATASTASFTSPNTEFQADSYYVVSVDFYAVQGFGAFYLIPEEEFDDNFIPKIDLPQVSYAAEGNPGLVNQSSWKTAQFFVKTDVMETRSFKLGLYLGSMTAESRGAIYFQNPRIDQVNLETFDRIYAEEMADTRESHLKMLLDLESKDVIENNFKIAEDHGVTFERNVVDPKQTVDTELFGTYSRPSISSSSIPALLNFEDVDYINLPKKSGVADLMLIAANNGEASIKLSEPFLIRRHQIYMLSFYSLAYSGVNSSMRIRDTQWRDKKADEFFDSGHKSLTISNKLELNGWNINTFFLTGENYYDALCDIEFWVGQQDSPANDYVIIDPSSFKINRISQEYFEKHGQGLTENSILLDTSTATSSIANSYFNLGTIRSVESPYPLKAKDWELNYAEGNDDLVLSGIVNTELEHWTRYANAGVGEPSNYGIATVCPGIIGGASPNNNVYMMQNKGRAWQTLTSPAIALGSGVTNLVSFDIMRQYIPADGLVFSVSAFVKGREISKLDLSKSRGGSHSIVSTDWEHYTFAINASVIANHELSLVFSLGTETSNSPAAIVFIDNVLFNQTDKDIPSDAVKTDLANPLKFFEGAGAQLTLLGDSLFIRNNNASMASSAVNTFTESISGGSFYEYRLKVKIVDNLKAYHLCVPEYPTDSNDINDFRGLSIDSPDDHEYGLNFTLDGFEGGIKNIKYEDVKDMEVLDEDGFTELVFYVRPDQDGDLTLKIAFGDEFMAVTGEIYIRDIKLKQIEEQDFLDAKEQYKDAIYAAFITESYVPQEDTTKGPRAPVQWWVIAPSLIMAVTILVAIAGFLLRKYTFRLHIDKHHTSYASDDRSARRMDK
ncbi:MAG: hypothetical protein LBG88_01605 [Christensenellaceae bacterium]|jgi:hypothetical protein|nr:hypothetical protein [Christensenellaceae bacterium]